MPKIGDILHGKELGKTGKYSAGKKFIYCVCPECAKERWLTLRPQTAAGYSRCQTCCARATLCILPHGRGPQCPHWKGGKYLHHQGYVNLWISEQDPYYLMATHKRRGGGTIFEHRLVMARSIGRCLSRTEHVHHINGDKLDNRLDNLELISPTNHMLYSKMCAHCKLRKENRILKREIKLLRTQLSKMFFTS